MTTQTAKFYIHRAGLSVFTLRELRELLSDRYLPEHVRIAIKTLLRS